MTTELISLAVRVSLEYPNMLIIFFVEESIQKYHYVSTPHVVSERFPLCFNICITYDV